MASLIPDARMNVRVNNVPRDQDAGMQGYVPEIDALRGFAMMAVVAIHAGILPFGWMGVWVFYVVSGFAVATSWLGRPVPPRAWHAFTIRRARRIWPAYALYLALAAGWLTAAGEWRLLADLPWLVTFTFNLRMILSAEEVWTGFGHLWTLAVEQQFYLLLPLIMLLGSRRRIMLALVLLALAAPLLRHAVTGLALDAGWDSGRAAFAAYAFAPAHFDAFAAGVAIALHREAIRLRPGLADAALLAAFAIATLHCGTFLAIGVARSGPEVDALRNIVSGILAGDGREVTVYYLPVTIAAAAIMAILSGRLWARRLFGPPLLQAIGRVSYGGYLIHLPVMMVLTSPALGLGFAGAERILLFLLNLAITLPLAAASHRWFEARFLRQRSAASGVLAAGPRAA